MTLCGREEEVVEVGVVGVPLRDPLDLLSGTSPPHAYVFRHMLVLLHAHTHAQS